jgi:EAL domain-containing protein (putative c-di-GMP-specific phosphodiesterase class I)/CheY-like chemotaxis protein
MGKPRLPSVAAATVLVVDDDPIVLAATTESVEALGYRVVTCAAGHEALEQLSQQVFDVMLTDVQMPGVGGLRLLRAVRDRDLDLPVVLMTGTLDVPTAVAAVEYGAFHYLLKPVGDSLAETLDRAANAGRMARLQRKYFDQLDGTLLAVADRAGLDAMLDRALASVWVAFQPIVRAADSSVFAHEAFMRSSEPMLPHPGAILEAAERVDRLNEVGREVRSEIAGAIEASSEDWTFFVNLHPQDLLDPALYYPESPLSRSSRRVVLEITERTSLDRFKDLRERVARLREMGFRIALDDLGAGYAGLTSFTSLEPEFVKLDISLVRDIHDNRTKQKIVSAMVSLCHDMGKQIIAEGVEAREEHEVLVSLGCDLLQGYFFGRPGSSFEPPPET